MEEGGRWRETDVLAVSGDLLLDGFCSVLDFVHPQELVCRLC